MKPLTKKILPVLFGCLCLCALAVAVSVGLEAKLDISYVPYNGDWQHYNMFRRLLDGQVPYRDFPVVLGQAFLYLNSAVLTVIGNTFANSIFSTNFVGAVIGFWIVTILLYLFFRGRNAAACGSLFLFLVILYFAAVQNLVQSVPFLSSVMVLLDKLLAKFALLYLAGNSSRPTRLLIAYIAAFLVLRFTVLDEKHRWLQRHPYRSGLVLGAIGSLLILWANDYGSSSYVAFSFCFFLLLLKKVPWKTLIQSCLVYIAGTLTSIACIMTLVTKGHLTLWLKQTFSITDFLWWFDGVFYDRKRLTGADYPPFTGEYALPILLCFAVLIFLLFRYFREPEPKPFLLGHLCLLASFFVFLVLNLISNGFEDQYAYSFIQYGTVLVFWLFCQLIRRFFFTGKEGSLENGVRLIVCGISVVLILFSGYHTVHSVRYCREHSQPDAAYVEELGGNCYTWHADLEETDARLGDATLFSTYGSALEVIRGTMQPTRYDYITHVFGNEARAEYLETFRTFDPDYVSVLNRDYTRWEAWVCNENWFFYREIAENYRYDFSNTFCRYLKKTGESNRVSADVTVTVNPINGQTAEILLTSSETEKTLIADVAITYDSVFTSGRVRSLAVHRLVGVTGDAEYLYPSSDFDAWFLPNSGDAYCVPVLIENGTGRIVLSVRPSSCTTLTVHSAEVLSLYDFELVFGPYEA